MPAPVVNSTLIQISAALRELPFNPVITCDSKTVTVTLRPHVGQPVTGTAVSFALAYTVAINQLRGASLINHVETQEAAQ